MAIANLANIPSDAPTLSEFSFAHMDHHRLINQFIQRKYGTVLPLFPIDPMNPDDFGTFAYQHQVMHTNQNQVLGIQGQDLFDVNFQDATQRAVWIWTNFTEHLQASQILGVG